jgi:hypothetical protein
MFPFRGTSLRIQAQLSQSPLPSDCVTYVEKDATHTENGNAHQMNARMLEGTRADSDLAL